MRWLALLALMIGCDPPHPGFSAATVRGSNIRAARDYEAKTIEECRRKRLAGELRTRLETVKCSEETVLDAFAAAGYPHMDLMQLRYAAREVCAERVDNGTWTESEAGLQWAQISAQVNSEERRRESEDEQIRIANARLSMEQQAERQRQAREMLRALTPTKPVHCTTKPGIGTVETECN